MALDLAVTEDLQITDLSEGIGDLALSLCVDVACRMAAGRAVTGSNYPNTRSAYLTLNHTTHIAQVADIKSFYKSDPRSLIRGCVNFGSEAVSHSNPL
jgi:hypothetical protein